MGMFDTVHFRCPSCGDGMEEQSKAGNCRLSNYSAGSVPMSIADNMVGETMWCSTCDGEFTIDVESPNLRARLFLKPRGYD